MTACARLFQSSPGQLAGCWEDVKAIHEVIRVSILTRPAGRVLGHLGELLCAGQVVSILTRPAGRVLGRLSGRFFRQWSTNSRKKTLSWFG